MFTHNLPRERPDCSVDPNCSKYVGQSDVEGVLCAGLQSHDVEEIVISCDLVGSVGVPSTRTLTSMGLSGLAKLSCTPAQHTGMLVVLNSTVGAVASERTIECMV